MATSQADEEGLFNAARQIGAGAARAQYLREGAGGDEGLLRRVEALLAVHDAPDRLLDRPAAAEFSFFLAIPTLSAAFAHELLEVSGNLERAPIAEIAVGFVTAFIASVLVVKPFLGMVRRSGFAPFAWYRIAAGAALLTAVYVF